MPRSSVARIASTASHRNVRDDREPPLIRRETRGVKSLICPTTEAECFLLEGWTDFRPDLPDGLLCRTTAAISFIANPQAVRQIGKAVNGVMIHRMAEQARTSSILL